LSKKNREIRRVPPGWQHPKSTDTDAFPSAAWAHPSVITRNEMAHDSYIRASLEDRYLGRMSPGDPEGNEARMDAVTKYRLDLGLSDGETFIPMHDQTFDEACVEWESYLLQWISGEYPNQPDDMPQTGPAFDEWHGPKPSQRQNSTTFRPTFDEAPTSWQVYETITDGTPVSPVFEQVNDLYRWLISDGGRDGAWNEIDALEVVECALARP